MRGHRTVLRRLSLLLVLAMLLWMFVVVVVVVVGMMDVDGSSTRVQHSTVLERTPGWKR